MQDLLAGIVIVAVWIILQVFVLPRFGVPT